MNMFKANMDIDQISDIVIFSDVDDCLVVSNRKKVEGLPAYPAGTNRDGEYISHFNSHHVALIRAFFNAGLVIPVTGRNTDALLRLELEFHGYKIVSHGGMILDGDNKPLDAWMDYREKSIDEYADYLEEFSAAIEMIDSDESLGLAVKVVSDSGYPMYLCVKSKAGEEDGLDTVLDILSKISGGNSRFQHNIHRNGRNLAFLPEHVSKAAAVEFLKKLLYSPHTPKMYIGVGDSHSDIEFMTRCDYMIAPNGSQITEMKDHG